MSACPHCRPLPRGPSPLPPYRDPLFTRGASRASAPKGDVWAAASSGDLERLVYSLRAGGSAEEADEVSGRLTRCLHALRLTHEPRLYSQRGVTAVAVAARGGHAAVVLALLNAGADATRTNSVSLPSPAPHFAPVNLVLALAVRLDAAALGCGRWPRGGPRRSAAPI